MRPTTSHGDPLVDRRTKHYFPANYSVPIQDLVKGGGPASEAESC